MRLSFIILLHPRTCSRMNSVQQSQWSQQWLLHNVHGAGSFKLSSIQNLNSKISIKDKPYLSEESHAQGALECVPHLCEFTHL